MSALVSGSEVAYFSLSPNDKEKLKSTNEAKSNSVLSLLETPNRLLATILIANNFINIAIVILSTVVTNRIFDFSINPKIGTLFQIIVVTFLLILFGEIIPKIYATGNTIRFARLMSGIFKVLMKIFWPVSSLLLQINARVKKHISENNKQTLSMKELSHVLEITEGVVTEDKEILEGIVKFGKTYVREIMKSRMDVVAIDTLMQYDELVALINEKGYSRIPVYDNSLDDIKGILYVKDLLPHLNQPDNFRWQALVRHAYFVPENKKINELLKEFQAKKIHMAMVIDEYGGIQGLVTLEDILEEIVGEIVDETDEEEPLFKQISPDVFIFEAKISLNDFYKTLDIPDNVFEAVKGEAETLAGLILEIKGEIPVKNTIFKYKYFTFDVLEVDDKRIRKIKVTLDKEKQQQEEE